MATFTLVTTSAAAFAALAQLHTEYDAALAASLTADREARELRDDLGRVRRDAGRRIKEATAGDPKPPSDTAIEKMAGDAPDYIAHVNRLADADDAKAMMAAEVASRKEALRSTRALAASLAEREIYDAARALHEGRVKPGI